MKWWLGIEINCTRRIYINIKLPEMKLIKKIIYDLKLDRWLLPSSYKLCCSQPVPNKNPPSWISIPKTKFLNFERRKIEFLDEILMKKHDFGVNFSVLASKF